MMISMSRTLKSGLGYSSRTGSQQARPQPHAFAQKPGGTAWLSGVKIGGSGFFGGDAQWKNAIDSGPE